MLFHPEKLKYKKYFRRKLKKKTYTYKNSKLFYKGYGFMVLETGYINEKQFKALY